MRVFRKRSRALLLALILFAAMYVLLLVFSEKRWIIALSAALVFVLLGAALLWLYTAGNILFLGAALNVALEQKR